MKRKLNIKIISLFLAVFCLLACFASCARGSAVYSGSESITDKSVNKGTQGKNDKSNEETESAPKELTIQEITERIKASVIKVICYDVDGVTPTSQGSGFFIDNKGTFITNAHVVENAIDVKIQNYLGITYDVDIMFAFNDNNSDYAVCRASDFYRSQPVEFATSAKSGDTVYALGYPNNVFNISVTEGKITNTDAIKGTKHFYANDAEIDHGSSGGVLVDNMGRVLGITTGITDGGVYLALKYQEFRFDADGEHNGGKAPYTFFYDLNQVSFDYSLMSEYFDINVNAISNTDTSVSYEINLKLKSDYKFKKIALTSINGTKLSVDIVTNYSYYDDKGTEVHFQSLNETLYLSFDSVEELKNGKTVTFESIYENTELEDYTIADIIYDWDFGRGQEGSILIYSKLENE